MNTPDLEDSHVIYFNGKLQAANVMLGALKELLEGDAEFVKEKDADAAEMYDSAMKLISVMNTQLWELQKHLSKRFNQ